ncbi:transposable element Tcb1 transposase [Trichonephila clavipes]|nr:transposable element Tcb1 transposase [Trichonephila clavipes]
MYGSTCADMQVDVMGVLSSIKHVVGNHWEVGGRPQCDQSGCRVRIAHSIVSRLWRQFQTTGTAIRGSVVVVHEEPHPQMTGTLSYRPEETGGRQREKSLDTRHRRLDDRYRAFYRGQKTARWWSVARRPVRLLCVPLTPAHRRRHSLWYREHRNWRDNEWGRLLFKDESRFSLSSDSHRILIWREREAAIIPRTSLKGDRRYALQFLFDDNAPCHRVSSCRTALREQTAAARTLPPVTIQGSFRLALQDEWAPMPQQLIDTPHSQHGQTL